MDHLDATGEADMGLPLHRHDKPLEANKFESKDAGKGLNEQTDVCILYSLIHELSQVGCGNIFAPNVALSLMIHLVTTTVETE